MDGPADLTERRQPRFLDHYRRITSSGQFIPEIDGLRFVAIFLVFVYHLAEDISRHSTQSAFRDFGWLFPATQILDVGVPLFFVISGFILCLPFAQAHLNSGKQVSLKKYFWRRVTRLEPPYFLSMLLFFLLKVAAGRGTAAVFLPNLIASFFYLHNAVFGRPSDINMVAWSLEIEIQFYILAPLIAYVFAIRGPRTRRTVLIALLVLATAIGTSVSGHERLRMSLLGQSQYFLAGFLLAEFYLFRGQTRNIRVWDLVSLAGWPLLVVLLFQGGAFIGWLEPAIMFILYVAAFQGVTVRRFFTNPWITTIGGMCYSIYLLHNYAIASLGFITERVYPNGSFPVRLLIQFTLMAPAVLAISAVYFRFIERPCMRPDWIQRVKRFLMIPKVVPQSAPVAESADAP